MLGGAFFLIFVLMVAYCVWRYYGTTDSTKSVAERIWLAATAAATGLVAALHAWFNSMP